MDVKHSLCERLSQNVLLNFKIQLSIYFDNSFGGSSDLLVIP